MKVKVLYFAGLREQLGSPGEDLELPAAGTTVAALRTQLMTRGGVWQSALAQGKALRVDFTVDDPETFNMPWSGKANYDRTKGPVEEIVCAENNKRADNGEDYPIPVSAKADF